MVALVDLQPIYIRPPFYIKEIMKSSQSIYFIYDSNKVQKHSLNIESLRNNTIEESNISLDLTGNPLQVDLSNDTSFLPVEEQIWSVEDNNYYPLPIKTVRNVINKFNRENCSDKGSYIYGLCDGADKRCTLILGVYQASDYLNRIEVYNLGCFYQNDIRISLEMMRKGHYDNVSRDEKNCPVTSEINATYAIYGNNLRNYKISNVLPYSSCILYNVAWNIYQYSVPEYVQSAEMTLQIIIGHKESELHMFWKQFTLLRMYMIILMKQPADFEKIILCDDSKSCGEICEEISYLLEETHTVRKVNCAKKVKGNIDVSNLRQEDLVDKLWLALTDCNNVEDLKICFHTLFEELAMKDTFKPTISEENKSSIAAIIKEISSGRLAVPSLTTLQALQFLVELGIEKLKNDYFYIVTYFDCMNYESLKNFWSKVIEEYTPVTESKCPDQNTTGDKVTARRIRLTAQPSLIEVSKQFSELNCLLRLHIGCCFLLLGRQAQLPNQESVNALAEALNEYIVMTDNIVLSKNYPSCMLEEITVKLQNNNIKTLESKDPTVWNVRFVSTHDGSVVTTTYYHTLRPLFPPSVYNKYEAPPASDGVNENIYYVTKMVNFNEKL